MSYRGNCPTHGPHYEDFCQECPQKLKPDYDRGPKPWGAGMEEELKQHRASQESREKAFLDKVHAIEERCRDEIANSGDC